MYGVGDGDEEDDNDDASRDGDGGMWWQGWRWPWQFTQLQVQMDYLDSEQFRTLLALTQEVPRNPAGTCSIFIVICILQQFEDKVGTRGVDVSRQPSDGFAMFGLS